MVNRESTPRAFISYAGPDRDLVSRVAASLRGAGIDTWWDTLLLPNEPFESQIQRVLMDVSIIVAVLSPRALEREWVRWELSQAIQNGLEVMPLLAKGLRREQLPPPLHLLSVIVLDGTSRSFDLAAERVNARVAASDKTASNHRKNDARRRFASAAAETARQAANIKARRRMPNEPPILVNSGHDVASGDPSARYVTSEGLEAFLADRMIAIAFTSFQTDELYLIGHTQGGRLSIDVQPYRKPTGLCVHDGTLRVGTLAHVYGLANVLTAGQLMDGTYSQCYVPRIAHLTGVLDIHDLSVTSRGESLFVATRFNCLATTSATHSFAPFWRPPFVSELVGEDRCHLNGLAMRGGVPAFVTAVAESDDHDGWREQFTSGGIVIQVGSDEIVCRGLSMPHSPRMAGETLWVLNSGKGELGRVDVSRTCSEAYEPISEFPGFTRGLAIHDGYAVVGLSRPRYDDFGALALGKRLADEQVSAWCGFQIVDTSSGECIHWLRVEGAIREIYDIAVLPEVSCPRSVSAMGDEAIEMITVDGSALDGPRSCP